MVSFIKISVQVWGYILCFILAISVSACKFERSSGQAPSNTLEEPPPSEPSPTSPPPEESPSEESAPPVESALPAQTPPPEEAPAPVPPVEEPAPVSSDPVSSDPVTEPSSSENPEGSSEPETVEASAVADIAISDIVWEPAGPGGGGALITTAADPDDAQKVALGTDVGGVYCSDDGGQHWIIGNNGLLADFKVNPYAIDYRSRDVERVKIFSNPDKAQGAPNPVFAATTSGLYKSEDGCQSFVNVIGAGQLNAIGAVAADDPKNSAFMVAGSYFGYYYLSHDAGDSWEAFDIHATLPKEDVNGDGSLDSASIRHAAIDSAKGVIFLGADTLGAANTYGLLRVDIASGRIEKVNLPPALSGKPSPRPVVYNLALDNASDSANPVLYAVFGTSDGGSPQDPSKWSGTLYRAKTAAFGTKLSWEGLTGNLPLWQYFDSTNDGIANPTYTKIGYGGLSVFPRNGKTGILMGAGRIDSVGVGIWYAEVVPAITNGSTAQNLIWQHIAFTNNSEANWIAHRWSGRVWELEKSKNTVIATGDNLARTEDLETLLKKFNPATAAENLAINANYGFEQLTQSAAPSKWEFAQGCIASGNTCAASSSLKRSGAFSLRVKTASSASSVRATMSDYLPVTAGAWYQGGAYVQVNKAPSGKENAVINFKFYNANYQEMGFGTGMIPGYSYALRSPWVYVSTYAQAPQVSSISSSIPGPAAYMRIILEVHTTDSEVYFDDIVATPVAGQVSGSTSYPRDWKQLMSFQDPNQSGDKHLWKTRGHDDTFFMDVAVDKSGKSYLGIADMRLWETDDGFDTFFSPLLKYHDDQNSMNWTQGWTASSGGGSSVTGDDVTSLYLAKNGDLLLAVSGGIDRVGKSYILKTSDEGVNFEVVHMLENAGGMLMAVDEPDDGEENEDSRLFAAVYFNGVYQSVNGGALSSMNVPTLAAACKSPSDNPDTCTRSYYPNVIAADKENKVLYVGFRVYPGTRLDHMYDGGSDDQTYGGGLWRYAYGTANPTWERLHYTLDMAVGSGTVRVNVLNDITAFAVSREEQNGAPVMALYVGVSNRGQIGDTPEKSLATGEGGLYKSVDGGKTWQRLLAVPSLSAIAVHPDNPELIAVAHAQAGKYLWPDPLVSGIPTGVLVSNDGFRTWKAMNRGLLYHLITKLIFDPYHRDKLYALSLGGGLFQGKITYTGD